MSFNALPITKIKSRCCMKMNPTSVTMKNDSENTLRVTF